MATNYVSEGGKKRPISPSIETWKWSNEAYLHVVSRFTGVGMCFGSAAIGAVGLFNCDIPSVWEAMKHSAPYAVPLVKFTFAAPFLYHTSMGYRHMFLDYTAKGFDQESQTQSMYACAGVSLGSAFLLMFYSH